MLYWHTSFQNFCYVEKTRMNLCNKLTRPSKMKFHDDLQETSYPSSLAIFVGDQDIKTNTQAQKKTTLTS